MNMQVTNLSDVKPFKSGWKVQVKLLHKWKQFTAQSGETLEMVFADANGFKIHASAKKAIISRVDKLLSVGEWKIIQNFTLSNASGQYRMTTNVYRMSFVHNTTITHSANQSNDMFFTLVDFENILSGSLKTCFLIDVIGQVLDVGLVQTVQCAGKERKKLEFYLRDINDLRIACCLWGKFAEIVNSACEQAEGGFVICLIRFAKVGKYRGEVQISNAFDASLVLVNPETKEAIELEKVFKNDDSAITVFENKEEKLELHQARENWSDYPDLTIAEVLSSEEIGKCRVLCTIDAIEKQWGWYYFGCAIHNKKCTKSSTKSITTGGQKIITQLWFCEVCNEDVANVKHKFKLHLRVRDETGITFLMLLDTPAMQIIGKSAEVLLNGSFEEIEDPDSIPLEITRLVGKTFRFGICMEKDNVVYDGDTYKAMKVWTAESLAISDSVTDSGSFSNKETTLITCDEESLLLTNSQENSDVLTTPSSKRSSEEVEHAPDLTSTSKKELIKKIKVEKMTEEELKTKKK